VRWQPAADGFRLQGLPAGAPAAEGLRADGSLAWLTPGVQLREGGPMLLGPEPILEPQALVLGLGEHLLRVTTDGLHPFTVSAAAP
jgi:general secretion pathway protein H